MIILGFTPEQEQIFINHVQLDRSLSIATVILLIMLILLALAKAYKMWNVFREISELLTLVKQYTEFSETQKTSSRNELLSKIGQTVADNVPQHVPAAVIVTPGDLPIKVEKLDESGPMKIVSKGE